MTALPTTLIPTLCKLIPLLGSDKDGEVLATVGAIGRVLCANKLDWHDLTSQLLPKAEDWHELLVFCVSRKDRLNAKEQDFLGTLGRWRGRPTEKQLRYLDGIAEKLRRATS